MSDPLTLIHGDALSSLRGLPDESVQCCVTSPPYFGLRDYGHEWQIGLEKTPDQYVGRLVEVFREMKRVLRRDGLLWLNLGDSYAGRWGDYGTRNGKQRPPRVSEEWKRPAYENQKAAPPTAQVAGCKPKDLIGIPWMVAFALRADGWYLRSDIIWAKPNPMPESVTDRPTKSHEYIFLLSKSERYYYNAAAIAEPVLQSSLVRAEAGVKFGGNNLCPDTRLQSGNEWKPKAEGRNSRLNVSRDPAHAHEYEGKNRKQWDASMGAFGVSRDGLNRSQDRNPESLTRNKRTVWTVATQAFSGAHFATFPPDLITPCILAGAEAGAVVIDPFAGSGTTGKVAIELGRKAILIEPKAEYVEMIKRRCQTTIGLPITA